MFFADAAEFRREGRSSVALDAAVDDATRFDAFVGSSAALRRVLAQVSRVAPLDSTVLILGETGTGKELVARAIQQRSKRALRPFVRVNCAAIPSSLIAAELFGYEKGAFTGALQRRVGRFEAAQGGTLFLDEVGELPMETQIALLRVLQERELERIGGSTPVRVDVRILAATNRDLEAAVASGAFRQDLYFRLEVFPIRVPPLRDRPEDIPQLVEHLVAQCAERVGKRFRRIGDATLRRLAAHPWPGNVRELQNVIERSVILCDDEVFSIDETWSAPDVPCTPEPQADSLVTALAQQEKRLIEAALRACNGRIAGPSGAASRLGIPRQTLQSKITAQGIDMQQFRSRGLH